MNTNAPAPHSALRWPDLRFLLQGNRRAMGGLTALSLLVALSETVVLAGIVQSAAALSAGRDTIELNLGGNPIVADVVKVLAVAVLAAATRGVLSGLVAVRGPLIAARSRERHRRALFEGYLSANWATQSSDQSGRLLQTLSGSVNEANTVLVVATLALPALVTLVVLTAAALVLNPGITALLVVFGIVVGAALRPLAARANQAARIDASGRNLIASHVAGIVSAGAEITVFGAREGAVSLARGYIAESEEAFARTDGAKRLVGASVQSVVFLVAAVGLFALTASSIDVDFVVVGTIIVLLLRGAGLAQQVQAAVAQYGSAAPFIAQVRTQIDHYRQHAQTYGGRTFPADPTLRLTNVRYSYPGSSVPAVSVDNLCVPSGTSIAILGRSGSGKSTLAQIILRLRQPETGTLIIGGIDISDIGEAEFSSHVAYVPQSPHLIPGSIGENIRFLRPDVSRDAVVLAAKAAHLHDEIERMPLGYDTVVDSHIDQISGGQKQRLALARALANKPRLLILDEPTSALDSENELAVLRALARLHGHTTVVMITHRTSTARGCDYVLVVDSGAVVAQGSPEEVLPGFADAEEPPKESRPGSQHS